MPPTASLMGLSFGVKLNRCRPQKISAEIDRAGDEIACSPLWEAAGTYDTGPRVEIDTSRIFHTSSGSRELSDFKTVYSNILFHLTISSARVDLWETSFGNFLRLHEDDECFDVESCYSIWYDSTEFAGIPHPLLTCGICHINSESLFRVSHVWQSVASWGGNRRLGVATRGLLRQEAEMNSKTGNIQKKYYKGWLWTTSDTAIDNQWTFISSLCARR